MPPTPDAGFEFGYVEPPRLPDDRLDELEARNALALACFVAECLLSQRRIILSQHLILTMHELIVRDTHPEAGGFRTRFRAAGTLVGVKAALIPRFVDEMCDQINLQDDPYYAAAFAL